MLGDCWERVRQRAPLIHNITNYVTANDVANLLLACGASPIMADDIREAADITALCAGLTLNLGTLSQRTFPSMLAAGKKANELGHPVLLDPVGAGAGPARTHAAQRLLRELRLTAIRCNMSEMRALFYPDAHSRGVDAAADDAVSEENLDAGVDFAKAAARRLGAVTAITGSIDLVSDGQRCYVIRNGRPEMGRVTGAGCQLSALACACLAANPDNALAAAAAAVAAMGLAGEIGWSHLAPYEGNAAYRGRIIDAVYHMDGETLERGAKYELR